MLRLNHGLNQDFENIVLILNKPRCEQIIGTNNDVVSQGVLCHVLLIRCNFKFKLTNNSNLTFEKWFGGFTRLMFDFSSIYRFGEQTSRFMVGTECEGGILRQ